jgi:putative transposase
MSEKYKYGNPDQLHFVTLTVVGFIDLFTYPNYKEILLDSLRYCQKEKGLVIYSWVIMSNHIHLIISSKGNDLGDIIRDFKRHTSKLLIQEIINGTDPRREWLLELFRTSASKLKRSNDYKVWMDGSHPIILDTDIMLEQRLEYLHQNPVKKGIVAEPEHYVYSSAIDYVGGYGELEIEFIT